MAALHFTKPSTQLVLLLCVSVALILHCEATDSSFFEKSIHGPTLYMMLQASGRRRSQRMPVIDDFYHKEQQFESAQRIKAHNQMRRDCFNVKQAQPTTSEQQAECADKLPPQPSMPSEVTIALHIHGNEFRHMVNHVHRFGMYVLQEMPRIHADTGCTVSFSDAGLQTTFSHIRASGPIQTIETAFHDFVKCVPLHVGIHLTFLRPSLRDERVRDRIAELMKHLPDVTVHFVGERDHHAPPSQAISTEKYAVLRAHRENREQLMLAAKTIGERLLSEPPADTLPQYSIGYILPKSERPWVMGIPDGSLISSLVETSGTTIRFPKMTVDCDLHISIFGSPMALIRASELLRRVSQIELTFQVDDADLAKPYNCHPTPDATVSELDDERLVLVTITRSPYQGDLNLGTHERIRHSITLKTSYENRHQLYAKRRALLKPELHAQLPLNKIEKEPMKPMFDKHLGNILKYVCSGAS